MSKQSFSMSFGGADYSFRPLEALAYNGQGGQMWEVCVNCDGALETLTLPPLFAPSRATRQEILERALRARKSATRDSEDLYL